MTRLLTSGTTGVKADDLKAMINKDRPSSLVSLPFPLEKSLWKYR